MTWELISKNDYGKREVIEVSANMASKLISERYRTPADAMKALKKKPGRVLDTYAGELRWR